MTINGIPYHTIIERILSKYKTSEVFNPLTKQYTYNFTCKSIQDKYYFNTLVKRYKCWGKLSRYTYVWTTKSKDLSIENEEVAEDIHDVDKFSVYAQECVGDFTEVTNHIQDASRYISVGYKIEDFKQNTPHINNEFKQKEKEMKKMKVSFDTRIEVNEKTFVIHKPDTAARAAVPILELSKRINFLEAEANELKDSLGDKAKAGKIFAMFNDEIEECQEVINYINECIED